MNINILSGMFEYLNLKSQVNLRKINISVFKNIHITNLHKIEYKYICKLSDEILLFYPNLKKIYAFNNKNITDNSIKHIKLCTLYASYNENITNNSIKHMNLCVLDAPNNKNITDDGIKHMNLHVLYASHNFNITENGLVLSR